MYFFLYQIIFFLICTDGDDYEMVPTGIVENGVEILEKRPKTDRSSRKKRNKKQGKFSPSRVGMEH